MESSDAPTATAITTSSSSTTHHSVSLPSSSYPLVAPISDHDYMSNGLVVISPCAACKILRRRCAAEKCVLAPYFPPTDPLKFTTAHRVFGASNIIKLLQELPEPQRADAVSSMVYEANARLRDPVYGCAGAICQLQKQVNELQAQLAKAQAELVNTQQQQSNLISLFCAEMAQYSTQAASPQQSFDDFMVNTSLQSNPSFLDENNLASLLEPLWT